MTLIDADKLKQHYAWLDREEKELFDQIVNGQPTIHIDQLVYEKAAELVDDLRERKIIEYLSDKTWHKTSELCESDAKNNAICILSDGHIVFLGVIATGISKDGERKVSVFPLQGKHENKNITWWKELPIYPPTPEMERNNDTERATG